MSVKELVLDSPINRMRANDLHDGKRGIALITENAPVGRSSMMITLDRGQQHLLMLYLQERLAQS